jgi:hypothetical protein
MVQADQATVVDGGNAAVAEHFSAAPGMADGITNAMYVQPVRPAAIPLWTAASGMNHFICRCVYFT